jgi:hypothetical protein
MTLDLRDLQLRLIPRRGLNLGAGMRAGDLFGAGAAASVSYDICRKLGAREAFQALSLARRSPWNTAAVAVVPLLVVVVGVASTKPGST